MTDCMLEPGSFRDRNGRILYWKGAVYRTLSAQAHAEWKKLSATRFFQQAQQEGSIVPTREVSDPEPQRFGEQWVGLLEHERLPFVSYPYEWSFSMLQDAALLQLDLILAGLQEGMIPKDASSYNVQWMGARPLFIDVASFETLAEGEPWAGYRQFCQLFLYPLLLQAYRNLEFHGWLRGSLDGIEPEQCNAVMSWRDRLRPGVFSHVYLQAKLQARYGGGQQDVKGQLRQAGFNRELIRANARKLRRLVAGLGWEPGRSIWSDYASDNTYSQADHQSKADFVQAAAERVQPELVWDLGANTGVFSRLAAKHAGYVVAMDGDHLAVERLYRQLREEKEERILPLCNDLADPSPNLGWRGRERKSLEERRRPDLVLCLALIHHMVIGSNIPVADFLAWLRQLGSAVVIEYVGKDDPMVQTLLLNKPDQYWDYDREPFERRLEELFEVVRREELKSGTRFLYLVTPGG